MAPLPVTPARPKRLRRPFRRGPRKPTRVELLELLRGLYGPEIPRLLGSPYEGEKFDDAEIILHELGHAVQIDGAMALGRMGPSWAVVDTYLKSQTGEVADAHEIAAIAIVVGVSRCLRLPLVREALTWSGARNSQLLHKDPDEFDRRVARAELTPTVHLGVQRVLDILDEAWLVVASFGVKAET